MINYINTNQGEYSYEVQEFILGTKKLDREIAKKNLLDFKKCFDNANISFGLIYGTLLGAIRENNFIEHDEDIDIFVLDEDREKVLNILFELKKLGLVVGRYSAEDDLISFIRDGEYIDIYFFKKSMMGYRIGNGSIIKEKYLENLVKIDFLGEKFLVPKDSKKLLKEIYGNDWETPKKDIKGRNFGPYLKIKFFLKNNFPNIFRIISWIKKLK